MKEALEHVSGGRRCLARPSERAIRSVHSNEPRDHGRDWSVPLGIAQAVRRKVARVVAVSRKASGGPWECRAERNRGSTRMSRPSRPSTRCISLITAAESWSRAAWIRARPWARAMSRSWLRTSRPCGWSLTSTSATSRRSASVRVAHRHGERAV